MYNYSTEIVEIEMQLSKKGEYALRALMVLGKKYPGMMQIQEIADEQNIPKKFLEQVLLLLKNTGYLQSHRGQHGGYSLRKRPDEITLGEVVRLIEGPLAPIGCASRSAPTPCPDCPNPQGECWLRSVMLDVRDAISGILDRITLDEMIERDRRLTHQDAEMYHI